MAYRGVFSDFIESSIGLAKFYYSRFFHVFENSFGPPGAGELKFELIPRKFQLLICGVLGPTKIRKLTPKSWINKYSRGIWGGATEPTVGVWMKQAFVNFGTWPEFISSCNYPPPPDEVKSSDCRVTYIGHSSVLLQTHESNVLIDPYFGNYAGYRYMLGRQDFFSLGIRRIRSPGLSSANCPPPHLILVTHDHSDSFDKSWVKSKLRWSGPVLMAGRGMSRHVWKREGPSTYFMDWYESVRYDHLNIHFLPAVHNSGRGQLFDRNGVLWGSFLIVTPTHIIYHAGGTGYSEHFKVIAEHVETTLKRQIDLAILPIGHYEIPVFQNLYLTPDDAVRAHIDLKAKQSLGVHHDTFPIGIERYGQPKMELLTALHRQQVSPSNFFLLDPGQHINLLGHQDNLQDNKLGSGSKTQHTDNNEEINKNKKKKNSKSTRQPVVVGNVKFDEWTETMKWQMWTDSFGFARNF